jgi:hypothetical protein
LNLACLASGLIKDCYANGGVGMEMFHLDQTNANSPHGCI